MLMNYNDQLIVAVIGLGVGAFHLANSIDYKYTKVKYICDTNQKKLSYYKKKFDIQVATKNFDEVVNDKEVNAIIIASYDNEHANQVLKALKNNKHVFIEKPMCLKLKDLDKITRIKKKKTKFILILKLDFKNTSFL